VEKGTAGDRARLTREVVEAANEGGMPAYPHDEQQSALSKLIAWRHMIEGQSVLGALIKHCIRSPESIEPQGVRSANHPRPFLTVITRTQGRRIGLMRDMLMSLAGQSCQDFEMFIVLHRCDETQSAAVHGLTSEFPASFRERLSVLGCERPGRAAPINEALERVRTRYVCVLDDDDFVFGHWVETFCRLSEEAPKGALLRAVTTLQNFEMISNPQKNSALARARTAFTMPWPSSYDIIDHLWANHTPLMSIAFPVEVFHDLEMRFDETLSTTEDWDLTARAAMICGVASVPEVTSVYRWWTNGESSKSVHSQDEWVLNHNRIIRKLDSFPLLLPTGTASRIKEMHEELEGQRGRIKELEAQRDRLTHRSRVLTEQLVAADLVVADLEPSPDFDEFVYQRLATLVTSTSWRLTRPVRLLVSLLRGSHMAELALDYLPPGFSERQRAIRAIVSSRSWRLTQPLRAFGSLLKSKRERS
jgi:Glycosyltransferase like family 2